jgi:hypothetical protein
MIRSPVNGSFVAKTTASSRPAKGEGAVCSNLSGVSSDFIVSEVVQSLPGDGLIERFNNGSIRHEAEREVFGNGMRNGDGGL